MRAKRSSIWGCKRPLLPKSPILKTAQNPENPYIFNPWKGPDVAATKRRWQVRPGLTCQRFCLRALLANTSLANACVAPPLPPLFTPSSRNSRKTGRPSCCWHSGAGAGPGLKCAYLGSGAPEARKSPPHPWPSESVLVPPGPNAHQNRNPDRTPERGREAKRRNADLAS